MAKWELTILSVCMHLHYGCCRSRLQWLQNAGNRMLFFYCSHSLFSWIFFVYSFRKAFKIFMADYSTCIHRTSYSFTALPTAQYNPSPILTNYYYYSGYSIVLNHKACIWTNCAARGEWLNFLEWRKKLGLF